jgi:probable HAF family extracellular repeat protein
MHRTTRAVVSALWIFVIASYANAAVTGGSLGFLPGDNYSSASGVNADGSVVAGTSGFQPYEGPGATYEAFRWTAGSGMVGLGHLAGDNYSQAYGVSGDGVVVVGTSQHVYLSGGQAFRWTSGSGMVGLGYLAGDTNSSAAAVSSNGAVIVGASGFQVYPGSPGTPGSYQAFRWTAGSGMVGLGFLPGATNSSAAGVSADGAVIVGTCSSASGYQAFRWTAGSGMVGLGFLPGATSSLASGISADGSVIVGTSGGLAFRWTAGSGMVGLGYLAGDMSSSGIAVNADGSVVLGESAPSYVAFRWSAGSGIESLPIENGNGVSADGNTVVGSSEQSDGSPEAVVVTLPGLIGASPWLSINSSLSTGRQLVLCWPTNYTGFTLQSSDLGSTNWTNCGNAAVSGTCFAVTNPICAGAQFFRLKR